MVVLVGDMNAKVGSNNINREEVMVKFGVGIMKYNRERSCDLCGTNGLVATGTVFPHEEIHKLTWKSPDGKTVNQIDHGLLCVNGRVRTSILDTKVIRGADVYGDHYLVRTRLRLQSCINDPLADKHPSIKALFAPTLIMMATPPCCTSSFPTYTTFSLPCSVLDPIPFHLVSLILNDIPHPAISLATFAFRVASAMILTF